jgi:MtrB/PioB family decaheme-associated outer membrane protein
MMKANNGKMVFSVLALAVQGAIAAMASLPIMAMAEGDDSVAALTSPSNSIEFGASSASDKSAKFGEYNGLNKGGVEFIGNVSIKGGDAYGQGSGTRRWSVTGSDLGTTSRELGASIADQGAWSLGVNYDELRHNTTTGYQTPYIGNMGGNNFTLPTGFAAVTNTVTGLTTTKQQQFNTVDVGNTRKNTSFNASYAFSPQWRFTVDYNNLEQSGAKLMAFGSDGGAAATGERISILPNPTNSTTDTVNAAFDWKGDKGNVTVGYFGSYYRDHIDRVTWSSFATAGASGVMTTPPSNEFHQLNLSGGYKLAAKTKLTGSLSYARNTQNDSFVNPSILAASNAGLMVTAAPVSSLNGLVETTHADLTLVDRTTKALNLSASVKYDKRDNKTASNFYNFNAIDGGNSANYPNTPYSYDKTQFELAGDYRLSDSHRIRLAYNRDEMKRWCNNYAFNTTTYPVGTDCLVDPKTTEDKFSLGYKLKANETVNLNVGYVYSDRKTDYDHNARTAMIGTKGGIYNPGAASVSQNVNYKGLNAGNLLGFNAIYDASRTQNLLKFGVNWDAGEKMSLGVNGRFADDKYTDATYGAQDGKSWSVNLDANFAVSDSGAVFAYVSQDYRDRYVKHLNRSTTAGYIWGDKLKDETTTYGFGFKQDGLMAGKLDLKGDFSYSDGKANYSTDYLQVVQGTSAATTCSTPAVLTCGATPDIQNKLTQLKLNGSYKYDKQRKVTLGYIWQRLSSDDYLYNGYQYTYTPTGVLPTNQQSGTYSQNVIYTTFTYSFR